MLELVNVERERVGVPQLVLGNNPVAQMHADSMLKNCFSAHWGLDGLTPTMRYNLLGGYQVNAENVSGLDYCYTKSDRVISRDTMLEVAQAVDGFMKSEGHRETMLDPNYSIASLGISYDAYNFQVSQHFEGYYIRYDHFPSIDEDGVLSLSGAVLNGASLSDSKDLEITVIYDQVPYELTRGQVSRTYGSCLGEVLLEVRGPAPRGTTWADDWYEGNRMECPSPYDVDPEAPGAVSPQEARNLFREAKEAWEFAEFAGRVRVPFVDATRWRVRESSFDVEVDMSSFLVSEGGVYMIVVWAEVEKRTEIVSEYSVWVGATPPEKYAEVLNGDYRFDNSQK